MVVLFKYLLFNLKYPEDVNNKNFFIHVSLPKLLKNKNLHH
jgi:hypothetical protein